jgi:hypothetical protein
VAWKGSPVARSMLASSKDRTVLPKKLSKNPHFLAEPLEGFLTFSPAIRDLYRGTSVVSLCPPYLRVATLANLVEQCPPAYPLRGGLSKAVQAPGTVHTSSACWNLINVDLITP